MEDDSKVVAIAVVEGDRNAPITCFRKITGTAYSIRAFVEEWNRKMDYGLSDKTINAITKDLTHGFDTHWIDERYCFQILFSDEEI